VGLLLSGAMLIVPLTLLGTGTAATTAGPDAAVSGRTTADASARLQIGGNLSWELTHFESKAHTTTTIATAPPVATTPDPPPTTTTEPPPPTTTTTTAAKPQISSTPPASGSGGNTATGIATWYSEAPAGTCASPSLPFGTTLNIVDLATGVSITCVVEDREAQNPGLNRVVDLSTEGFTELAPLSQGVITVTITW